jgi:enterochelin esterase-like enzyme
VESQHEHSGRVSPLVEELEDGRCRVTVAYRDDAANDIWVIGGLAGADPADRRMRPAGDGWWERSYELESDVRTGYWFTTALVPSGGGDLIADPLNPREHIYTANPDYPEDEDLTLSLIELPRATPFRWSVPAEGAEQGEVVMERIASARLGNERQVFIYTPAGYDTGRTYPLLICFDGWAYVQQAYVPLPTVLDNLIADGAIPPVVAVLPDSLDSATRARELNQHEPFVEFLADELLPWARERLSFEDDPARTVVAGSSLGGLTAAFCGLRRPDLFGLVLSQSARSSAACRPDSREQTACHFGSRSTLASSRPRHSNSSRRSTTPTCTCATCWLRRATRSRSGSSPVATTTSGGERRLPTV